MGAKHTATRLRQQAGQYRKLGELAAIQPEEVRTRRTEAENAYTNVLSRLGAEGTYGPNASQGSNDPNESIFKSQEITDQITGSMHESKKDLHASGSIGKTTMKANVIDQEKFQKKVEGSTQFRLMSKLTAEAEQLVNREGPLYEEMINNLQLPIMEGSAALARENTDQIRRAMQRGGSARRSAFEAVQKMRQQERVNSAKIQQLSQVRAGLDQWARENAKSTLEFGQSWASNLGGIRESYQSAMDGAADMMLTKAMPLVFRAEDSAAESERAAEGVRAQMHAANRAKTGKWITGIMAVGSLAMGGLGAMGMMGMGGSGMVGKAAGALSKHTGSLLSQGINLGTAALGSNGQE